MALLSSRLGLSALARSYWAWCWIALLAPHITIKIGIDIGALNSSMIPFGTVNAGRNEFHLKEWYVDRETIAVTGFLFNDLGSNAAVVPDWVEKLFGSSAVFFKHVSSLDNLIPHIESLDVIQQAQERFKLGSIHLPKVPQRESGAGAVQCSIELMAYLRVHQQQPFNRRDDGPTVGTATLMLQLNSGSSSSSGQSSSIFERWHCWYRSVYTNWRNFDDDISYWPTLLYCPALEDATCKSFKQQHMGGRAVQQELMIELRDQELLYRAAFITVHDPHRGDWLFANDSSSNGSSSSSSNSDNSDGGGSGREPLGVCTAWPYVSADVAKVAANQAMAYEFLRYYANLGIKVFAYDAFGGILNGLFESPYARANPQQPAFAGAVARSLVAHNFTMLHLLQPQWTKYSFDNNLGAMKELDGQPMNVLRLDNDKTLTLTQCRFEARAIYGIERVLAADFDEFLYCSKGGRQSPQQQRHYLDAFVDRYARTNTQLSFLMMDRPSRVPGTTRRQCVIDQVAAATAAVTTTRSTAARTRTSTAAVGVAANGTGAVSGSVLSCFVSDAYSGGTGCCPKSMQTHYACPLTNFHHSCGHDDRYDCICNSMNVPNGECKILHLSTHLEKDEHPAAAENVKQLMNEVWFINNAS